MSMIQLQSAMEKTRHSLCFATTSTYLAQQLSMQTETHVHVEPGGQ